MALPSWWQVATPHRDIVEGKLSEAIFAADLGDVVFGKAPVEYTDPVTFFQKTYMTEGLKNLLENVLNRLCNGKGDPVIQLQTPFGGGKTHSLLALYHVVKNRDKVKHIDFIDKLPELRNAKVVVFVGTQADALKGKTPWGEIASQLGVYDKVREHDEKRRSPGKERLNDILGDGPVLILMDELAEYAVKAKDFADQLLAFSQEITETVKTKDNCCLVCTLPSSTPYGEEGERSLRNLQRVFGRVESIYTPVEDFEIYEVVRKRLFENLGEEKTRKKVAQAYFDMYSKLGEDVPKEVKEINYREQIEHAYPFHPELIDVLYERWGSLPDFQRTRGVLRLLALVVEDLYKNRYPAPLIQSSLVNLKNPEIRREFTKHIGKEYDSVIEADIAGKNANAPKIDKKMGSEYDKYKIAAGIATSVFIYSFSGGEKNSTTLPKLRVSLLREHIHSSIVGDAIAKLEEELWYFYSEKKQYSFRNQPNLNRVIVSKEETINEKKMNERLKENIKRNAGDSLGIYLWPENSTDIPDTKHLKLALLSPDYTAGSEKCEKMVSEFLERAGSGFRVYKNTLFIIAMDESQYAQLSKAMKRFLALSDLHEDKNLNLMKETQEELKKKLKEAEEDIPFIILKAYSHLAVIEESGLQWKDLGIPTIGKNATISEQVKQYLRSQERILSKLTPKYIIEKTFGKDENEKPLSSIYEFFLKTPGMLIPESEDTLLQAVKEGVKSGVIGVKDTTTGSIYFSEEINPTMDSIILNGEEAKRLKGLSKQENTDPVEETTIDDGTEVRDGERGITEDGSSRGRSTGGGITAGWAGTRDRCVEKGIQTPIEEFGEAQGGDNSVKTFDLKAKIEPDKLNDIFKGVISPLKQAANESFELHIEIKAKSGVGISRQILDIKVKETLMQTKSVIENWKAD